MDILWASAELELLLLVPRVRSVFSESVKGVQLGNDGPPGGGWGETGWRAITRVFEATGRVANTTHTDFINLIFPSDCRACGAPMIAVSGAAVCEACIARVAAQTDILCSRCGDALGMESARFAAGLGATECTMCRLAPPEFARAVAFAVYDDEVRELLHLLKFNGMRRIADRVLGDGMAQAFLQLEEQAASQLVVVPVPLFATRQRSRGFNQAEVLAKAGIVKLKKLRPPWKLALHDDVLLRVKDTRSLFALTPPQRRTSLRGAFRVAQAEAIRNREVLLVDDIMTTGATARECAKVLLRAGAAKVWVATLARAQAEGASAVSRASDIAAWDAPASSPATQSLIEPQAGQRQKFVQ